MNLSDITAIKDMRSGTAVNITAVKLSNGVQIWPVAPSYELRNIQVGYSSGYRINAAGTNYAYVTADLYTSDGTLVTSGVSLRYVSSTSIFHADPSDSTHILGNNLGVDIISQQTASVNLAYDNQQSGIHLTASANITQEANAVESTTTETEVQFVGSFEMPDMPAEYSERYDEWFVYPDTYGQSSDFICDFNSAGKGKLTEVYEISTYTSGESLEEIIDSELVSLGLLGSSRQGLHLEVEDGQDWIHIVYPEEEGNIGIEVDEYVEDEGMRRAGYVWLKYGSETVRTIWLYQNAHQDA